MTSAWWRFTRPEMVIRMTCSGIEARDFVGEWPRLSIWIGVRPAKAGMFSGS